MDDSTQAGGTSRTVVHLVRHGEVYNPTGVLYGRLPDFHLSDLGERMAERVAEHFAGNDITHLVASPLERAQETAQPMAKTLGLDIHTDERVVEAANQFEGKVFGVGDGALRHPATWWLLRNPLKPSWGEPYAVIAARMLAAVADARDAARGHEAVIVSHQLPVWIARMALEGRRFVHDPRRRECSLASVTSAGYHGDRLVSVAYNEPAGDLIPVALRNKFTGGRMTVRSLSRRGLHVAAVLAVLAAVGCSQSKANQTTGGFVSGNGAITVVKAAERKPAPDLAGQNLDGRQIALSDFRGKVVVINVWASWCGPCREEAPELSKAAKRLRDKDVQFLGIAIRDEASNAKAFNNRWDVTYPSINDPSSRTLLGFRDSLPAAAIPTTYVIDRQGRVAVRILDKTTTSTLTGLVQDVRSGKAGKAESGGSS